MPFVKTRLHEKTLLYSICLAVCTVLIFENRHELFCAESCQWGSRSRERCIASEVFATHHQLQSNPVFWTRLVIFEALPWPKRWFNQKRVVIWLWVDSLAYKISKNQLPKSKTVASSHKKVHFWNPIWRTPSALWNGTSPISLSFLIWSRWDLVCRNNLGSPWLVSNLALSRD